MDCLARSMSRRSVYDRGGDSRPDLWFAFADPIEVPWGSHIAQSLVDRAWGCLWAALGLMLLAALFDPAPLTG